MAQIEFDKWQQEIIDDDSNNIAIRAGRQVGKSFVIAHKCARYALNNPNKTVLVIASVDRQATLLFEKILETLIQLDNKSVSKGRDRPTKHHVKLKNGTRIYSLPTGRSGYGIRGYTIDLLIADEAAFIPEEVWVAVAPMLATTGGKMILLSTPWGKRGYFYDCFKDETFKTWHVNAEECPRVPESFIKQQKKRLTKLAYEQEVLGNFLDELIAFFPTKLIDERSLIKEMSASVRGDFYLGVDVARYGGDENAFVIIQMLSDSNLRLFHVETTERVAITDTIDKIKELEELFKFSKIYIDDGGLGAGVLDVLLKVDNIKRKIMGINNASKSIDREDKRRRLLKEDLYTNLLSLMQQEKILLLDHDELKRSLQSIQFEYTEDGNLKISGRYSHIAEAAIRAAWCVYEKGLNIYYH